MASAWSQLDQLLTCAICLDRYRNPKLLPCQHTFCMEPCLDGLIDYARRQIKCPECRAEHRIPYQGIQQFPTNVTLMRFLELHRDITGEEPEPPPSMMERCSVCSEKSNVDRCAHCDKKICPDCKEAHVDILRREINRINNQVRRGLHRLSEALTQTKKNAEKLQFNCNQVKEEIEDIVRRYSKDLRVTEDKLKRDLEMYTQSEMKSINKLKEDLEVEVSNISSNCDLVDKYIRDDFEWSDAELLEYKQIFLKMLDFLRTFDPDNADFARRIKFQPRADPDVLHRNIADFGELKINAPMAVGAPPQSNALVRSQSDHRLAAQFARRDNRSFSDVHQRLEGDRPTSPRGRREPEPASTGYGGGRRFGRSGDYEQRNSSRFASREDGSRWREGEDYGHRRYADDAEPEPHARTVRFADEPASHQTRMFDVDDATKGPLSGVIRLSDSPKIMERLHQNEVRQKVGQQQDKDAPPPSPPVVRAATPPPPTRRQTSRQQSEDDIDRQKRANQQQAAASATVETAAVEDRSRRRTSIEQEQQQQQPASRLARPPLVKATPLDAPAPPLDKKPLPSPRHEEESDESESEEEEEEEEVVADEPPRPVQSSFFSRQRRLPEPDARLLEMHDDSDDEEEDEDEDDEEDYDEAASPTEPDVQPPVADSKEHTLSSSSSSSDASDSDDSDEDEPVKNETAAVVEADVNNLDRHRISDDDIDDDDDDDDDAAANQRRLSYEANGRKRSDDTDGTDSSSASSNYQSVNSPSAVNDDDEERLSSSRFRRRPFLPRSKSSHEIGLGFDDDDDETPATPSAPASYRSRRSEGNVVNGIRTRSGAAPSSPLATPTSSNSYWAEYLKNKYGRSAAAAVVPRSRSSHALYRRASEDSDDGAEAPPYGSFSSPRSTYLQKRRMLFKAGARGSEPGQFTWPRGVAVGPDGAIVVADSSNHRVQVFDAIGKFSHEFGSHGSGEGQFDCLAGVSVNRIGQFIVSDRYNHRVQLFDPTGRFLRSFGCEGRTDGRFNYPWGIATDSLGFIYVCDKDNHRIQVFQSDGTFVGKFGSAGSRPGQLDHPHYVSVTHTNRVVVSDTHNHRVQVFDVNGRSLTTFGCEGSAEGQFKFPRGVAVDDQGYIVVGDSGNNRVQVFGPDGAFLRAFGAWGAQDGEFKGLEGLAVTSGGSIVVCDRENHRIQVF